MPHGNTATSPPHKTAILAIILISYVMIVLDISVVLTGLPKIHNELGFTDAGLAWVQSAYTLTFGGFLLLGARAGDILGRRRMFVIGIAIFTVASVAIGASQSSAWMLSWRAVQGLGSAILAPTTLALLQTTYDEGEERVRAVSFYSAAAGVSATVGLVVGGLLADWLSWRIGFLINLPIGIAMIIAARIYIHETNRRRNVRPARRSDVHAGHGCLRLRLHPVRAGRLGYNDFRYHCRSHLHSLCVCLD
ncbi:MFS transporter [Aliirhizobium cellulosilyticum]|uniref:MFS family permease n=1 Tax=Aliirhizobium cellulosilyticum TaxID=393664 RepID=A0A7W6TI90_9HYPH|nr:MFS transporter [Rhizobium cellulosilyticum]MBB4350733.1 MFS family permease [Rhizobium cellulosilyticum]MBB4413928.1 MFS family permease [Rhizobium cellulosilyticum]MBB4448543.1 MFS family permease [Rhizobium cellulosilyticum]